MFQVNDKVVYIGRCRIAKASGKGVAGIRKRLTKGKVYCVSAVWTSTLAHGSAMLDVTGFEPFLNAQGNRVGYAQIWFRKVSEVQAEKVRCFFSARPTGR